MPQYFADQGRKVNASPGQIKVHNNMGAKKPLTPFPLMGGTTTEITNVQTFAVFHGIQALPDTAASLYLTVGPALQINLL